MARRNVHQIIGKVLLSFKLTNFEVITFIRKSENSLIRHL